MLEVDNIESTQTKWSDAAAHSSTTEQLLQQCMEAKRLVSEDLIQPLT